MSKEQEKKQVQTIIEYLENNKPYDAFLSIRYGLNKNSSWAYKPMNEIIDNQITNLVYDIQENKTLTLEFFKRQLNKLERDL